MFASAAGGLDACSLSCDVQVSGDGAAARSVALGPRPSASALRMEAAPARPELFPGGSLAWRCPVSTCSELLLRAVPSDCLGADCAPWRPGSFWGSVSEPRLCVRLLVFLALTAQVVSVMGTYLR